MFDWGMIVSGLLGIVGGGGLTAFFLRKQTKASAEADALDKAAQAMKLILENTTSQQDVFNNQIKQKDELIEQNRFLISKLQDEITENKKQISELKLQVAELTRKVRGHQDLLTREIGKKKYAERIICFKESCQDREPELGEFNTPDPI